MTMSAENSAEAMERMDAPWLGDRPPIHRILLEALAARESAPTGSHVVLPEKDDEEASEEIRWAPGALDSLFGSPDTSARQIKARSLVAAIGKTLRWPTTENAAHLYKLLQECEAISIVDETLERLSADISRRRELMAALARRLICEAPDIEPVKIGVALLGVTGVEADASLVAEISQHEDITLYGVVALSNLLPDPESAIWDVAKSVHGWGRIQAIERLTSTSRPDIKAWLLRDGFRNRIMFEYMAYPCATSGGLLEAISAPEIDDALLLGAGEMLAALVGAWRPAKSMEDYRDGAAACVAFLRYMSVRPLCDLRTIEAALRIRLLAKGERAEKLKALPGWTAQAFLDIRSHVATIVRNPSVIAVVNEALDSESEDSFCVAADIAPHFGTDPWPIRFERQRSRAGDQWFWLMQTKDGDRIERVLELARGQLNLELVGSGPLQSRGLGMKFKDDDALVFVLQDLRRFPGKGWDLLKVGLRGRPIGLRNMAINVLREWGQGAWPPDAMRELELAVKKEPHQRVRQRMHDLMRGRLRD